MGERDEMKCVKSQGRKCELAGESWTQNWSDHISVLINSVCY